LQDLSLAVLRLVAAGDCFRIHGAIKGPDERLIAQDAGVAVARRSIAVERAMAWCNTHLTNL